MDLIHAFERSCIRLRHSPWLKQAAPVWNLLRPAYDRALHAIGRKGLERRINGTDTLLVIPELRAIQEIYEPEIWALLMGKIGPGSRVIDVGANVGLYAVAVGHRVGNEGRVLAVEPDPQSASLLQRQIDLNGLQHIVTVLPVAFSDQCGRADLSTRGTESRVTPTDDWGSGTTTVALTTLDDATSGESWNLLLIDVEGFEEKVLRGGHALLSDPLRRPHTVIVEVHPYLWAEPGTTSDSILHELRQHGYSIQFPDGTSVQTIEHYGHIVATVSSQ